MTPVITGNESLFEAFLNQHDDQAWARTLDNLEASIHPVDSKATRIWFAFFPLKLHRALAATTEPEKTRQELGLSGRYRLTDQVDSSHQFLYGHRYWRQVKAEVTHYLQGPPPTSLRLEEQILEVARQVSTSLAVERNLLVGICAVAFMTLQQVGSEVFRRQAEELSYTADWRKSPDQIVGGRKRDDGQGLLGFLRTIDKKYTVTFREFQADCSFRLVNQQELTTAAANDRRDYRARDSRCVEGPIPVECRTAACGTCWIGVLSDANKLADPTPREIRKMKDFGYSGFTAESDSPIRLACQARGQGNVSIVIPPWNGMIGKLNEQL